MIDESLGCLEKCELALTVICNAITDSDRTKSELLKVEDAKGSSRLTIQDKIDIMLKEIEKY
jgi:hypothetical protein